MENFINEGNKHVLNMFKTYYNTIYLQIHAFFFLPRGGLTYEINNALPSRTLHPRP